MAITGKKCQWVGTWRIRLIEGKDLEFRIHGNRKVRIEKSGGRYLSQPWAVDPFVVIELQKISFLRVQKK